MNWLATLNGDFSNWLWSYKTVLITSWVAVLLVLYGANVNRLFKKLMRPYHYLFRLAAFVLLCSIGYGLLATYGEHLVAYLIEMAPRRWFAAMVITIYLLLGVLAEQKQQA